MRRAALASCLIAVLVSLAACSRSPGEGAETTAVNPPAQVEEALSSDDQVADQRAPVDGAADDGIADEPDPTIVGLAGSWSLWEDTEGGTVCPIELKETPVLGGHALEVDQACVEQLDLAGDMHAWFVDERDRSLVIVDATRKAIVRLPRSGGTEFYLPREAGRRYGLMLSPAR